MPYYKKNNENAEAEITRVQLPNKNNGELFGIVDKLLGSARMTVMCEDGKTRTLRVPGKIKKKMWIKEGDLVILKPWGFQDDKGDIVYRYSHTQVSYLSRNRLLPEILDVFGKA